MNNRTKRNIDYIVTKMDDSAGAVFMAREALAHVDLTDAPETFSVLEKADWQACHDEMDALIDAIGQVHRRYLGLLCAYTEPREKKVVTIKEA